MFRFAYLFLLFKLTFEWRPSRFDMISATFQYIWHLLVGFHIQVWLVVWNMAFMTFPSYWEYIVSPTDFHSLHHFSRGIGRSTTNQLCYIYIIYIIITIIGIITTNQKLGRLDLCPGGAPNFRPGQGGHGCSRLGPAEECGGRASPHGGPQSSLRCTLRNAGESWVI